MLCPEKIKGINVLDKEILEMRANGRTCREIAVFLGFQDKMVVKRFFNRYHRKQRQLDYENFHLRPKGRPQKDGSNHTISSDEIIKLVLCQDVEIVMTMLLQIISLVS